MSRTTRNTVARKRILQLISSANSTLSHSQLQEKLAGICDRVTIYRVLDRLVEEEFIHRIINVNGVVNYAPCKQCNHFTDNLTMERHKHLHFSCLKCGVITCLNDQRLLFNLPENYLVKEYQLTISGLCPGCQ
jgi:Fur family ferric uptake transcriptional regulator